jgi:hypothetical protein
MIEELLGKIASLAPPLHLFGGVAEDILLGGTVKPGHRDLDLLVASENLAAAAEQLLAVGLTWEPNEDQPGRPWVFRSDGGLPVEVWPCVVNQEVCTVIVPGKGGRRFRLSLPSDTFEYPATVLAGVTVHTVSPLALYLMRVASAWTRYEGERREGDLQVAATIRSALVSNCPESKLALVLEEL